MQFASTVAYIEQCKFIGLQRKNKCTSVYLLQARIQYTWGAYTGLRYAL